MRNDTFGADALAKATRDSLDALPKESAHVGVVTNKDDAGVEGAVSKSTGRGTFVEAEGSWYVRGGYRVAAFFGWKGKS